MRNRRPPDVFRKKWAVCRFKPADDDKPVRTIQEVIMKLYSASAPNPRRVRIFLAEKGAAVISESIGNPSHLSLPPFEIRSPL